MNVARFLGAWVVEFLEADLPHLFPWRRLQHVKKKSTSC